MEYNLANVSPGIIAIIAAEEFDTFLACLLQLVSKSIGLAILADTPFEVVDRMLQVRSDPVIFTLYTLPYLCYPTYLPT